jgi:hypothetical protein
MPAWILDRNELWNPLPLEPCGAVLILDGEGRIAADPATGERLAAIMPWNDAHGRRQYVLFPAATSRCLVNGMPSFAHRILSDKDEIAFRHGDRRLQVYFSAETLPEIRAFSPPDGTGAAFCMRCKLRVEPGSPAVCCPDCRLWHHESAERPCWSYDAVCANCRRPTAMDYSWRPEPVAGRAVSDSRRVRRPAVEQSHE